MKDKLKKFFAKNGVKAVLSSLISIVAGLLIGFIIMLIIALFTKGMKPKDALDGLWILIRGPFSSGKSTYVLQNFGNMIFYAAPLILTGLSVAIAFKTGLFNIGAPGQFLMGTTGSLMVALSIKANSSFEGLLIWILALTVGILLGMLWGAIPGLFKAFFGVNEVIVCIMTNWIAANLVSWFFSEQPNLINTGHGKSGYLITTEQTGTGTPKAFFETLFKGSYIDIGILLAVFFAIVIYVVLNKTTFGYEIKACGFNRNAAKYAGMNEKRNIILSMAIAGGLAALGGAIYYLNPGIEFKFSSAYSKLPDYGFNGIAAAFLASNNPIGVIFSGIFLRFLGQGGDNLTSAGYNRYISDIIIALIILFAGISAYIRGRLSFQKKKPQTAVKNTVETRFAPDDAKKEEKEGK